MKPKIAFFDFASCEGCQLQGEITRRVSVQLTPETRRESPPAHDNGIDTPGGHDGRRTTSSNLVNCLRNAE
ncbi:MAG: hypothetical protein A2Z51_04050 [Deltaproteobacteria bacterium RBG_19FT_COMBO_52_11]|nr:MAG: hypothetical protein A2Z51_04050 [Deltaproteobacteria bacterium RBG_19FT_COMBO_52_11]